MQIRPLRTLALIALGVGFSLAPFLAPAAWADIAPVQPGSIGRLDLAVGSFEQIVKPTNMAPGRSYVENLNIRNAGTIDLSYTSELFVSGTPGIAASQQPGRDAAQESDEPGEVARDGSGGAYPDLIVTVFVDSNHDGRADPAEVLYRSGDLSTVLEKSHGHGALLSGDVFPAPRYLASPTDTYVYRSPHLNEVFNPTDPSRLVTAEDLSVQVDYAEHADQNNEQAGTISLRFVQTAKQVIEEPVAAPSAPKQNDPPAAKTGWSVPDVLETPAVSIPLFLLALGAVYLIWRRRRTSPIA